ncbi:tRNA pseudouridine synthase 3 [Schistosoma haematobium]|uniref:tRNA pseudouridine synthase 3 n=1 Tax=Schistosoma haematobium TaxID=6185 RepID=A0A922LY88_SCHHA|nr:tRNA pseudouridine synthase 3 [Schistosoma haematobium]KAH9596096.1 tRNA pseudouridine synthase 3 [Schistosoma haematobium]CAH8479051.1 unnamed protein product [Schistosoma haematobium]CAH8480967.1 unnamed protein product [Schistosoma haematobium]
MKSSHKNLKLFKSSSRQCLFSTQTSISRLEGVRRIMEEYNGDTFVIILGVDSLFNRGSVKAASYLLFNAYEVNCSGLTECTHELDILEDMFMCIHLNEVILYCNFASFSLISPYVSHWPNLRIHYVNENYMIDPEKHEDVKISVFESTLSNFKRIIIPYTDPQSDRNKMFNKLMIENWPLVQSYAYDIRRQLSREFFTLSREVIDVGDSLCQLTERIDPVFIECFVSKTIISFATSFELALRTIDSTYQFNQSQELTEKQIEGLTNIYKYSNKRDNDHIKRCICPPFLLYGINTTKNYLKFPYTLSLKTHRNDNIHMIIHGSEQTVGISCERTYFMQKSIRPNNKQNTLLKTLIEIYLHIINAVAMLIKQIKTTLTDLDEIATKIKEGIEKKINFVKYDKIDIEFEYVHGKRSEAVHLITLLVRIYDIQDEDGQTVGSMGFKDTLLISSLKLNTILISRNVINLTENIPYICYWTPIEEFLKLIEKEIDGREKCLLNGELEIVTIPVGNMCLSLINCICYHNRIILYGKRHGVSALEPKKINHFRSSDTSQSDLIELQFNPDIFKNANEFISPYLYSALLEEIDETGRHTSIWLIVKQRSKIRRLLIKNVFPVWRSTGLLEVPSNKPNHCVTKASFISHHLEQEFSKTTSDDDTISGKKLGEKSEFKDEDCNLLMAQLLTHQPSTKHWIQIFRDELSHVEASVCFNVPIPTANTCVNLCLKCGINPQSYIIMEHGQKIDWNYIINEAVIGKNIQVYNKYKETPFNVTDRVPNDHPEISKLQFKETNSSDNRKFNCMKLASSLTMLKNPLTITVICGPPGSRKELVVVNILNFVKECIEWIEIKPDNSDEITTSLHNALLKYCEIQCKINNGNGLKPRCHGILLCPDIIGSREILASIAELHQKIEVNENTTLIKIGCVATCVDLRMAIMDNGRMTFPGVLELIAEGWTNYLLLTGPAKSNQVNATKMGVPFTEIEELLHSVNPRLSHLFIPDGKTENSHTLEALMDENEFSNPTLQRARLLSYPSLCTLTPPSPRLRNITLHFNRQLDRKLLMNALNGIFKDLKPWPFHGNIYTLCGQIAFVDDSSKLYELDYVTLSGINCLYQVNKKSNRKDKPYWLTCTIADSSNNMENSNELNNLFANWIRETIAKHEKPRELIKRSDLTEEDFNKIHERYHLYPLPQGWYYTGTYYVNMDGEKLFQHPSINQFIEEYIEGENTKIEARNARLRCHPVPDLFS